MILRTSLCALAAVSLLGTQAANAVDLQNCSRGATGKRLACLEANVKLLNSSYQMVTTELRGAVADLKKQLASIPPPPPSPAAELAELRSAVADLKKQLASIPPPPPSPAPDLAELRGAVADLKKQLASVPPPPPPPPAPDLSGFVRYDTKIRLRSSARDGTCLDHDTNDAGRIQGSACNDSGAQDWTVEKR